MVHYRMLILCTYVLSESKKSLADPIFRRPYCQRISNQHPSEESNFDSDLLDIRPSPVRRSESNLSQMTITQRVPGGDGKIVLFVCILEWHTKANTNTTYV